VDLRADEVRRQLEDLGDVDSVLGGDRRDGRSAVHAERRKRLQVGLDACAAARVGPGDGEGDRKLHARRRTAYTTAATPMLTRPLMSAPCRPRMTGSLKKFSKPNVLPKMFW